MLHGKYITVTIIHNKYMKDLVSTMTNIISLVIAAAINFSTNFDSISTSLIFQIIVMFRLDRATPQLIGPNLLSRPKNLRNVLSLYHI